MKTKDSISNSIFYNSGWIGLHLALTVFFHATLYAVLKSAQYSEFISLIIAVISFFLSLLIPTIKHFLPTNANLRITTTLYYFIPASLFGLIMFFLSPSVSEIGPINIAPSPISAVEGQFTEDDLLFRDDFEKVISTKWQVINQGFTVVDDTLVLQGGQISIPVGTDNYAIRTRIKGNNWRIFFGAELTSQQLNGNLVINNAKYFECNPQECTFGDINGGVARRGVLRPTPSPFAVNSLTDNEFHEVLVLVNRNSYQVSIDGKFVGTFTQVFPETAYNGHSGVTVASTNANINPVIELFEIFFLKVNSE